MKKILFLLFFVILVSGCVSQEMQVNENVEPVENWKSVELTDVITGETFTVAQYAGKPILVESFAVWCPTCTKQQKEIKRVKELRGEEIIHISIDTDPNEDENKVIRHANDNNFDWHYSVSPSEVTNALIEEFGLTVVNAPSAPVILICEDQSTRLLEKGVKTAEELIQEVEGC